MKIVCINAVYKYSSTGRYVYETHQYFQECGFESWVYCSGETYGDDNVRKIGNRFDYKLHAFISRALGLQGYFSRCSTKRFLNELEKINPDVVHLHNLHSNYINLPMLLEYLARKDIATVITLQDFWFMTGHCCHFITDNCEKWLSECRECPILDKYNRSWFFDWSNKIFNDKKRLLLSIPRLGVIGNSEWTTSLAEQSFLKDAMIIRKVSSWINLDAFVPKDRAIRRNQLSIASDMFVLLGVAQGWSKHKGVDRFFDVAREMLGITVVLVGENSQILREGLPENVILVDATDSIDELAEYYSMADLFMHPSPAETFGNVCAEAMACGTPIVVNNATALPEFVEDGCGYKVDGDKLESYIECILEVKRNGKEYYSQACIDSVHRRFERRKNIEQYVEVYNELIKRY